METNTTTGRKILKGALIVGLFMLLAKFVGFIQKIVIAKYFGTGHEADAFTVAFNSIVFTFCLFPSQMLSPFLPIFVETREKKSEEEAWKLAGTTGAITAVIMAVAIGAAILGADYLVFAASSFKSVETTNLVIKLTRFMLPAAFFMALFYLFALLMNSYKRFALPAFGDSLNKIVAIVFLVVLVSASGIFSLAAGVVAGAITSLAVLVVAFRRQLPFLRNGVSMGHPGLVQLGRLLPPILVGILIAQTRTILDYKFASGMGEGFTSSLGYARALSDTLVLLVPSALGIVIYPYFAEMEASGNREKLTETLMGSLRLIVFIFIPVSILMMILRVPLIQVLFQRGKFDMASVMMTAEPMFYYSMGIAVFASEIIIMRFYYSAKNTLVPAVVGVICVGIHVAVILLLKGTMQHQSIALAATVSKTVKIAALILLAGGMISSFQVRTNSVFAGKTVISSLLMALATYFTFKALRTALVAPADTGKMLALAYPCAQMALSVTAGLAAYVISAFLLKTEELKICLSVLKRKKSAAAGPQTTVSDAG